jgi:hypothetical protein
MRMLIDSKFMRSLDVVFVSNRLVGYRGSIYFLSKYDFENVRIARA